MNEQIENIFDKNTTKTSPMSKLSVTKPSKKQQGFSFMEIMIVIILMAGIAAIAVPAFFGKLDEANIKTATIQMRSLGSALDFYHLDNSVYPSTEQGLEALISKPEVGKVPKNWKGPYLNSGIPNDPWNNDYAYRSAGSSFQIISFGADGEEDGEDVNADIIFKK